MMVIGIIVILITIMVAAFGTHQQKANKRNTQALFHTINLKLQEYRELAGEFPPDGFDAPVETSDNAYPVQSGAALAYFLTRPMVLRTEKSDGSFKETERPSLMKLTEKCMRRSDESDPELVEIVDAWNEPIHYDRVATPDDYSIQESGDIHFEEVEAHGLDPREDPDHVPEVGPQNPGKYDLWSHGPEGHTEEEDLADMINNWEEEE